MCVCVCVFCVHMLQVGELGNRKTVLVITRALKQKPFSAVTNERGVAKTRTLVTRVELAISDPFGLNGVRNK